jgi:hypothetical protein
MSEASPSSGAFLCTMTTETRTYVGKSGTITLEGWDGFQQGASYELHVKHHTTGTVVILLDQYVQKSARVWRLVLSKEEYDLLFI